MNQRKILLTVLVSTVLVSGCISILNGGEGEGTSSGPVTIEELSVDRTNIDAGSTVRTGITVVNSGEIPTQVELGDMGRRILQDYCPDIFDINEESFTARKTGDDDITEREEVEISPGDRIMINWELEQNDEDRIPLHGFDCNLNYRVPFDYEVEGYQQLQVKASPQEETLETLDSQSTPGPMDVDIDLRGSSAEEGEPIYIEGDNIEAQIRLRNVQDEEGAYTGLIELEKPEIITSENINADCPEDDEIGEIVMYQDQSQVIECDITVEDDNFRSISGEIRVRSEYEYTATISERTVEVNPSA